MKPLFIPLRSAWFRAFEAKEKDTEYRAYGHRWNERTCFIGRKVVLAHGYGWPRLNKKIVGFKMLVRADAPKVAKDIYPDAAFIAAIQLR